MIAGIGIDSVEIKRFALWKDFPQEKLLKTLSQDEINYCLSHTQKATERFAARFATKEAFFKAFSFLEPNNKIPLLTICKHISVKQENNGSPKLLISWEKLPQTTKQLSAFISITHTDSTATVIVILEYKQ